MTEKDNVPVTYARLYDTYFGLVFQNQLRSETRGNIKVQGNSPRRFTRIEQPSRTSSVPFIANCTDRRRNYVDDRRVTALSAFECVFLSEPDIFGTHHAPTIQLSELCSHLKNAFFLWRQAFDYEHLQHYYYCANTMEITWSPPKLGFSPVPIQRLYRSTGNSSSKLHFRKTVTYSPAKIPHVKYWSQRHRYFTLFDHGTCLDTEAWYSITPEQIAAHQATRCNYSLIRPVDFSRACEKNTPRVVIYDLFCGAGGNAIAFARKTGAHVIAYDINMAQLHFALRNAVTYGVGFSIDFIRDNSVAFLKGVLIDNHRLTQHHLADMIFLSPPWGGPSYSSGDTFDLRSALVGGHSFLELLVLALQITPNVAFFLPRNTDVLPLLDASLYNSATRGDDAVIRLEVEKNYINGKFKAITVYFGKLASSL
jgi:trimethylguanosine synthase